MCLCYPLNRAHCMTTTPPEEFVVKDGEIAGRLQFNPHRDAWFLLLYAVKEHPLVVSRHLLQTIYVYIEDTSQGALTKKLTFENSLHVPLGPVDTMSDQGLFEVGDHSGSIGNQPLQIEQLLYSRRCPLIKMHQLRWWRKSGKLLDTHPRCGHESLQPLSPAWLHLPGLCVDFHTFPGRNQQECRRQGTWPHSNHLGRANVQRQFKMMLSRTCYKASLDILGLVTTTIADAKPCTVHDDGKSDLNTLKARKFNARSSVFDSKPRTVTISEGSHCTTKDETFGPQQSLTLNAPFSRPPDATYTVLGTLYIEAWNWICDITRVSGLISGDGRSRPATSASTSSWLPFSANSNATPNPASHVQGSNIDPEDVVDRIQVASP
ncbi:uncharacterized protein LACBIDRAFT_333850 [Laccaria bicolor S238N-H82]|uniref:Predicted protein n=1 Tax=Laccaria bicolor (strain S238N-H82 / ATCC MYA-4686) TaxID=486041 RepID=B0DXA1_LACBS|nr:uncharacterized protein LACBIDRAFT_333850 [Laccaria bicolor S238N-H82]EDR00758.1 predicted protein [Laccaria bicolor S238N-H82]|eukprot:XP_001888550.1 predicted protein [Laccaria bicolor S238N-H82]